MSGVLLVTGIFWINKLIYYYLLHLDAASQKYKRFQIVLNMTATAVIIRGVKMNNICSLRLLINATVR